MEPCKFWLCRTVSHSPCPQWSWLAFFQLIIQRTSGMFVTSDAFIHHQPNSSPYPITPESSEDKRQLFCSVSGKQESSFVPDEWRKQMWSKVACQCWETGSKHTNSWKNAIKKLQHNPAIFKQQTIHKSTMRGIKFCNLWVSKEHNKNVCRHDTSKLSQIKTLVYSTCNNNNNNGNL